MKKTDLVKELRNKLGEWVRVEVNTPERFEVIWGQLRGFKDIGDKLQIFIVDYNYPINIEDTEIQDVELLNG